MPHRALQKPPRRAAAKQRATKALELISTLREELSEQAAAAFAEHLRDAEKDLRSLAERSDNTGRRDLYESAFAVLRANGTGLLSAFRNSYTTACDQAVAELRGKRVEQPTNADELSLVDRSEFERDLAVGRLSAKAAYACMDQLTALERRICVLLGVGRVDSESNPFSIKRLFGAFLHAVREQWTDEELALTLLETFEHYTVQKLPDIYKDLNATLSEHGVLERLDMESDPPERDQAQPQPHDNTAGQQAPGSPAGATSSKRTEGDQSAVNDVFLTMARGLLAAKEAAAAKASGSKPGIAAPGEQTIHPPKPAPDLAGTEPAWGTEADGEAAARMGPAVLSQLLEGLTGLQRGNDRAAEMLGVDPAEYDPTTSAILHVLAASPLLRWLQPTEAVTVNLTAALFDYILSDAEVAQPMRGELGRLQLPILKVALLNKAFFADSDHPARRLMDLIDETTRGWNERYEARVTETIRTAVTRVLEGFDSDTDIFVAQARRLQLLLEEAERSAREKVGALVQRLEQRDRRLIAERVVGDAIDKRLAGAHVPVPVDEFIRSLWSEVLAALYVAEGSTGTGWRRGLDTVDDLVWSLRPKRDPLDRERLMRMLPDLLQRLPDGLARINRSDAWHPFLRVLMPLHMAAIKPVAQSAYPPRTGPRGEGPSAARSGSQAAGPAPAVDASAHRGDECDPSAAALAVGDWVEFADIDGAQLTLRAKWISDVSGLILFADRQGQNPLVITRAQLTGHLRKGSTRLLSRDPLTDRAVAQLLVYATPDGAAPSQRPA